MDVTRNCPNCKELNAIGGDVLDENRDVGVELWGECWSCQGRFRLTRPGDGGEGEDVVSASTPIASPYLFHMWRPIE